VGQEAIVDLPLALQGGDDEPAERDEGYDRPEDEEFPALIHTSSPQWAERCGVNDFGLALVEIHRKPMPRMRLKLETFASLTLLALLLAGCDRCGDPVHINVPGEPKSCYETGPQK
jgi:hypothetical protein